MFFKNGKVNNRENKEGRVYVFRITLACSKIIWKVGMTHSDRATDRMFEVLRSFFQVHRYSPKCELKRDKKVLIPRLVEKHMHSLLDEWRYTLDKPSDGSTEFFHNLDEEVLLDYLDNFAYETLLQTTSLKESDHTKILDAIEKTNPTPIIDNSIPF
ncbi:MAG: hypothetical protein DRG30_10145 [Epsilonproteobacteria bacterium]|nr:MAG: hypothetical protein DRG30_10145 [Campylobacterota bacterium]